MRYYNIAGVTIAAEGFEREYVIRRMREYEISECSADITVNYSEPEKINAPAGKYIATGMGYREYYRGNGYLFYDLLEERKYSAGVEVAENLASASAELIDLEHLGGASLGIRSFNCFGEIFKYCILNNNGVIMHSSTIAYKGCGILFSAPSGTGKSTHTGLWKKYYGGDTVIINDDMPAVRFNENIPQVSGTPWSGKTEINANITAPVKAIVMLEQKKENSIRRIDGAEAVFRVLNELTRPVFPELMDKTLEYIEQLVSSVPVYLLGCNISREAVDIVKEAVGL